MAGEFTNSSSKLDRVPVDFYPELRTNITRPEKTHAKPASESTRPGERNAGRGLNMSLAVREANDAHRRQAAPPKTGTQPILRDLELSEFLSALERFVASPYPLETQTLKAILDAVVRHGVPSDEKAFFVGLRLAEALLMGAPRSDEEASEVLQPMILDALRTAIDGAVRAETIEALACALQSVREDLGATEQPKAGTKLVDDLFRRIDLGQSDGPSLARAVGALGASGLGRAAARAGLLERIRSRKLPSSLSNNLAIAELFQ